MTVTTAVTLASCQAAGTFGGGEVEWEVTSPEAEGLSGDRMDRLRSSMARGGTDALLVARSGRIAYEWYGGGAGPSELYPVASLTKSLAGGMALLVALSDDVLDLDERVAEAIPAWRHDPLRSRITVRHLATHSSGLPHGKVDGLVVDSAWARTFWERDPDPNADVIDHAPVRFEPGTDYAYSGPAFAALAYALSVRLSSPEAADVGRVLRDRLMRPLGIPDDAWSAGYGEVYQVDGLRVIPLWGGGRYTARAVARLGQFMLNHGRWQKEALVDSLSVRRVVEYAGIPPASRLPDGHPAPAAAWWTNANAAWPGLPCETLLGAGAEHQILALIPPLDLVIVRLGGRMTEAAFGEPEFWAALQRELLLPLLEAVVQGGGTAPRGCGADG